MEFIGINWGYLIIQLAIFALIASLVISALLFIIRKLDNKPTDQQTN